MISIYFKPNMCTCEGSIMEKAAFFDIDGTLYGFDGKEHRIPDSTKMALREFRNNGNLAFICSGRPMRFINQIFGRDMFDGYICTNGTYIIYDGNCIYNKTVNAEIITKLKNAFDELGIRCSFVGQYNGYPYKMEEKEIDKYNSQFKGESYLVRTWEADSIQVNALDIFYNNESHLRSCKEYFKDDFIFNTHGAHMSADVSFRNFDKSDGIKFVINALGINRENTFAFGDGYNDITMFKAVNVGIAMGNAVEELKDIASYVTDNIFNDGLYNAMKRYELISR